MNLLEGYGRVIAAITFADVVVGDFDGVVSGCGYVKRP
jgi:hypothetical protein